jgi:hypothetical protein
MLKPDFLPFTHPDIPYEQKVIAGAYILFLDVEKANSGGISKAQIYFELTGYEGGARETVSQKQIVSRVGTAVSHFAGAMNRVDELKVAEQILARHAQANLL